MRLKRIARALTLALGAVLLAGCAGPVGGISLFEGYGRSRSQSSSGAQYSTGGASISQTVRDIEVDWSAGEVDIVYHDGEAIEFSETANRTLNDSTALCYYLEGDTLHIRFMRGEKHFWDNLSKTLTLSLPRSLTLNELDVEAAAASVKADALSARKVDIETSSGKVEVKASGITDSLSVDTSSGSVTAEVSGVRKIGIETTSGAIQLTAPGETDKVELETTSGSVNAALGTVRELDVQTVSGTITVSADNAAEADVESVSGTVDLVLGQVPAECDIETTSGAVTLTLPWGASFSARVETVSGGFASDFAMTKNGKTYTTGGTNRLNVEIESISGGVILRAGAR